LRALFADNLGNYNEMRSCDFLLAITSVLVAMGTLGLISAVLLLLGPNTAPSPSKGCVQQQEPQQQQQQQQRMLDVEAATSASATPRVTTRRMAFQ
jgi:hypothetical protein